MVTRRIETCVPVLGNDAGAPRLYCLILQQYYTARVQNCLLVVLLSV